MRLFLFSGARVRIESEIQRGQVHNRTCSHGEGERLGLGARSMLDAGRAPHVIATGGRPSGHSAVQHP